MSATVGEVLSELNYDIFNMKKYEGNSYLRNLLDAAFIPEKKFILPEGEAPYKPSTFNVTETQGTFWQWCRKLDIFQRRDLSAMKREMQFITALESLSPEDAKILCAVKEQELSKLYPNLTFESLVSVGYFKE